MWRARIPSSWRLGSSWPGLARALQASARKRPSFSGGSTATGTVGSEKTKTTALALGGGVTFALAAYSIARPKSDSESMPVPAADASQYFELAKPVSQGRLIPYSEVQKHNSVESCWVIISGTVYDVTSFIDKHPGGRNAILKAAGMDATYVSLLFSPIHPPGILDTLPPEALLGPVDPETVPRLAVEPSAEEKRIAAARAALPHPGAALNLDDIEALAYQVLTATAWAYYSSAGDDEETNRENNAAFKRLWFRPRVLNKVSEISTDRKVLSFPSSLPIFVAPTALARLGHPGGELNILRAAAMEGIIQAISNNASCSIEEIMTARSTKQPLFFQFYMNRNREASEATLRRVETSGFDAVFLTVDAAVPGKRERDQRIQGGFNGPAQNGTARAGVGVGKSISGYQDPDVCWADIPWIQGITKLPLVLKGIQCVEDAEKAFEYGVQGIVLSNHGGRQLDFSPAPITILQELRERRPDLLERDDFHVFIDGGIRRGTDVLKALCLGARAVGLGRPFLYANGVWGEEGARRVIQIMREEVETGMRLLGVTRLDELKPEMVRYVDKDPSPSTPPPKFILGPR